MYQVKIVGCSNSYLNGRSMETEGKINCDGTVVVYENGVVWFVQASCLFPL